MIKILPQSIYSTMFSSKKQPVIQKQTSAVDSVSLNNITKSPDYIPSKMLLSLLKSTLNGEKADASLFQGRSYEDWVRMYNLGYDNAVTPLLLDGLKNTPEIKVPDDVLENMKLTEDFAKHYHMKQEKLLGEIIDLSSKKDIDVVPIKGIGFSLNYPDPQRRFGGDIDVFTFKHGTDSSKVKNNMTYAFDEIFAGKGVEIDTHHPKHSEFKYKGMPIENHRHFVDVDNSNIKVPMAKQVDKYLMRVFNPAEKVLPMGTKVLVPSKEFNNVFLAFHSMTHFLFGGINFHHLADWAVHIQKNSLVIPDELKGTTIEKFMNAMTNLSNKYLGTSVKTPENKKLEDAIFNKMLDPMGEYPTNKIQKPVTKNPLKVLKYKYDVIKSEELRKIELLGPEAGSVKGAMFKSLKYHILKPKTFLHVLRLV